MTQYKRKSRRVFCLAAYCLAAFATRGTAQEEIVPHGYTYSQLESFLPGQLAE